MVIKHKKIEYFIADGDTQYSITYIPPDNWFFYMIENNTDHPTNSTIRFDPSDELKTKILQTISDYEK